MFSKRYKNEYIYNTRRSFWDFLLWKLGRYDDSSQMPPMPKDFSFPLNLPSYDERLPSCSWMGHSTFLIQAFGTSILTDPVWDTHCAPLRLAVFQRTHEPPILLSNLPPIDCILISHNHYDHLDAKTVQTIHSLHPEAEWVVPLGLKKWFRKRGIHKVHELDRWNSCSFKNCKITAVPSQHFSGRGLLDTDATFWNGYVAEFEAEPSLQKRLYFTGDTGYNPIEFKDIGIRWPYMDLSLIPIGTYVPQKFMQPVHCSPWEAVEIHLDVRSKLSVGMHWKTFRLSDEPLDRPPYDLYLAMKRRKVPLETFLALEPGVRINW